MRDEPSRDRDLLLEIVEELEGHGLGCDEYRLQHVIDVEALETVVDSGPSDLEIRFSVGEFRLLVSQSSVRVIEVP